MKAGFILPSDKHNYKPFKNPPLGMLYLLTILEKDFGKDVDLSLTDLRGIKEENEIYNIPQKDLFFYSPTSQEYPQVKRIVERLREVYPEAKYVAGGPHINIFPEESSRVFDSIAIGEGEETIKQIVRDYMGSGLERVYKQEGQVDINRYPFPLRKYISKLAAADKGTLNRNYPDLMSAIVMFSRGCPFNCHFCVNLTNGQTRVRNPELIEEEIRYLKREYGVGGLILKDDNAISVNRDIARKTLEALARSDVVWQGQSRANGISPDMVRLAKDSGCIELAVGIESVSERALQIMNKRIDLAEAKNYIKLLKQEGIDRRLLLITGLPGEPKDIADRTIDFIKESEPSSVLLSILCPTPGSEVYSHPEKFGIIIDKNRSFEEYFTAFGRFDGRERPSLLFRYEKVTPFGEGMSENEIIDNHMKVQQYVRDHGLNF